jgi:hypothetical protein
MTNLLQVADETETLFQGYRCGVLLYGKRPYSNKFFNYISREANYGNK